MVVVFHTLGMVEPVWLQGSWRRAAWQLGPTGVAIFFVLSGFLLWRPYVAATFDNASSPNVGTYAIRRVARIVPGYWCALLGGVLLAGAVVRGPGGALTHMFLVQNYRSGYALEGLGVGWTLVIETSFYVLLPIAGAIALRRGARGHLEVCAGLVVIAIASRAWWAWGPDPGVLVRGTWFQPNGAITFWVTSYLDLFAVGMVFAVWSHPESPGRLGHALMRSLGGRPWRALLLAAALYPAIAQLHLGGRGLADWKPGDAFIADLLRLALAGLVVLPAVTRPTAADPPSLYRRLCSTPLLVWLGMLSYGIYLWHLTWLHVGIDIFGTPHHPATRIGIAGFTVLATVGTALVSWHLVERPVMGAAERFDRLRIDGFRSRPTR